MTTATLDTPAQIDPLDLLTRDLKRAATTLTDTEARYLVDQYYVMQEDRKRAHNQVRAMRDDPTVPEPHDIIIWLAENSQRMENNIKAALDVYSASKPLGQWARSIVGIGPVISAGLLAHIDIKKAPTAGHIWRFAGLDPTLVWEKKTKRPFNAQLKTLCWKIGESFVKTCNNVASQYGPVYLARKAQETAANDAGAFAVQAAEKLTRFKIGKDTEAYKWYSEGKLPPAHIHARAKRYAVKLFLAHYQGVGYELEYGEPPPKPYILTQDGHAHFIAPPDWPQP